MSHENTPTPGHASGQPDAEGARADAQPAADVPEAEVPAADAPEDGAASAGAPAAAGPTRRARFAAWRRERPFAGGILAVLSGLVLYFSGRLELDSFEIQLGIEGMQSTLLPVALVALGVLLIVQPQFRVFYGVITLAISVYSLLGVNLGGFGIGMVLGVVGGILAVSWMPRDPAAADGGAAADDGVAADGGVAVGGGVAADGGDPPGRPEDDAPADDAAFSGAFDELLPFGDADDGRGAKDDAADEEVRPRSADPNPARRSAAVAVVAALALMVPLPATPAAGATQAGALAADICWDPLDWIESITCEDDEAEPEPSPSATQDGGEDAGAGDDAGSGGAGDGAGDDGAGGTDDAGQDRGQPDDDAKADGEDADGSDEEGDDEKGKDDGPASEKEAREDVKEAATLELGPCARITFGGEYDINVSLPGDCGTPEDANVFSLDGELETRDLQLPLTGLNGISVVNVPVTTDGPRRDALKISVDSVKVPGFWLKTYALGGDTLGGTVTNADYVSMEGNAQMFISSIHANLPDGEDFAELGEQIAGGASLVEMLLAMTDARIGLMGATSDVQVWSDFREQVWQE